MLENLVFSLEATVPIFLLMLVGVLLRRIGWIEEEFAMKLNRFVFKLPLPVLVFSDLATVDFKKAWNGRFVGFCFVVTVLCILIAVLISFLWRDQSVRGEFVQASYRSSAALLGIALITNIYGKAGMGPMMIIGSVPLYNVMAVVILSLMHPTQAKWNRVLLLRTFRGIVTNPILIGIVAGLLWSALRIPMPVILGKTVDSIGAMATPLGLIAMGAMFDLRQAVKEKAPAIAASFLKLVGFAAIFLPVAVWLGYRREELIAILVMLGTATTVSSFVMAKNMGHRGVLSSSVVMLTTLLAGFTLTGWIFLLKSFGWL